MHYVWIVNTLRQRRKLTLSELNDLWVTDEVAEGNPLPRSSFNKYRDAILDMFGLIIECDTTYHYYISNPREIDEDHTKQWMLSTLTTGLTLSGSSAIKDSIILENVPAGYEFLPTILQAIRQTRVIMMSYQKFGFAPYTKPVNPYAVRLFRQRWYLLADNGERMAIYALDRMQSVVLTDQHRCLNSCVRDILVCGSQLFAKVQDPYLYLTGPRIYTVVRLQTEENEPCRLADWLNLKSEVHYC